MRKLKPGTKFVLSFVFLLAVLPGGWWLYENERGASAWQEAQARAEAAGISLARADYAGPEIPDKENLLLHPVFSKEFAKPEQDHLKEWSELPTVGDNPGFLDPSLGVTIDYRESFSEDLSENEARARMAAAAHDFEKRLDDLAEAILTAPGALVFAEQNATCDLTAVAESGIPFSSNLQRCLGDSILMAIRSGEGDRALDRLRVLDRWNRMLAGPTLLHLVIAVGGFSNELDLIWEGLRLEVWTENELEVLVALVSQWDFKTRVSRALEFEMAFLLESLTLLEQGDEEERSLTSAGTTRGIDWRWERGPTGWSQSRKAELVFGALDIIEVIRDDSGLRPDELKKKNKVTSPWSSLDLIQQALETYRSVAQTILSHSTTKQHVALIALELECHQFKNGSYPRSLEELSLNFPVIDRIDPDRRPLTYRLGKTGRPQINFANFEGEENPAWRYDPTSEIN